MAAPDCAVELIYASHLVVQRVGVNVAILACGLQVQVWPTPVQPQKQKDVDAIGIDALAGHEAKRRKTRPQIGGVRSFVLKPVVDAIEPIVEGPIIVAPAESDSDSSKVDEGEISPMEDDSDAVAVPVPEPVVQPALPAEEEHSSDADDEALPGGPGVLAFLHPREPRERRQFDWGPFKLARIKRGGWGITCALHRNTSRQCRTICKKSCTSRLLSDDQIIIGLKRWALLGSGIDIILNATTTAQIDHLAVWSDDLCTRPIGIAEDLDVERDVLFPD
jgi:hypothetical protein